MTQFQPLLDTADFAPALLASGVSALSGMTTLFFLAAPLILILGFIGVLARHAVKRLDTGTAKLPVPDGVSVALVLGLGVAIATGALMTSFYTANWSAGKMGRVGVVFAIAVLLIAIKPLRRYAILLVDKVNAAVGRHEFATALAVMALVAIYLPLVSLKHDWALIPMIHDELSYAVMARIFASGHLWMPAHPLPEALETFYVYTSPVYGSMYFPGTGLIFAVPLLLGLPLWVGAAVVSGGFMAMLFRVLGRLFSPAAGLASVFALLATTHFCWLSLRILSHVPMATVVLLAYWAYLKWDERPTKRWLAAFAAFGAFAVIIRPYDTVLILLPTATLVVVRLVRHGPRAAVGGLLIVAACCAPPLGLQLVLNKAYTGSVLTTPFGHYFDKDMPNAGFGFYATDPAIRPQTKLPQKIDFYDEFAADQMNVHTIEIVSTPRFWGARIATCFQSMYGYIPMIALMPLGLLAARWPRAGPIAMALPVLFIGYLPYPYFLNWYNTGIIVSIFVCFYSALRPLAQAVGARPETLEACVIVATALSGLTNQPYWWREDGEVPFQSRSVIAADELIRDHTKRPALVFFVYDDQTKYSSESEPVYNLQTAWPDDADVVRVHSLSNEMDLRTLRYYQKQNGQRQVYLFIQKSLSLSSLGTIDDFVKRLTENRTTRPTTGPE